MSTTMWMTILAATSMIKTNLADDINAARHVGRLDIMEICTPTDSGLMQACMEKGLQGKRLSNWSGHDLATDVGTQRTLEELRLWKPRKVWWSPPCDPFSSLQNINQRTEEQVRKLKAKRRRGWRILRHIKWIIGQLQSEEADI